MTNILTLVGSIVNGAQAAESTSTYHYERAEVAGKVQAERWLMNWRDDSGQHPWRLGDSGETTRRKAAGHWLFLRFVFRHELLGREALGGGGR